MLHVFYMEVSRKREVSSSTQKFMEGDSSINMVKDEREGRKSKICSKVRIWREEAKGFFFK